MGKLVFLCLGKGKSSKSCTLYSIIKLHLTKIHGINWSCQYHDINLVMLTPACV